LVNIEVSDQEYRINLFFFFTTSFFKKMFSFRPSVLALACAIELSPTTAATLFKDDFSNGIDMSVWKHEITMGKIIRFLPPLTHLVAAALSLLSPVARCFHFRLLLSP